MTDKLTAALMAYAQKKMDGNCALFQTDEEVTACPALTMPPPAACTGDSAERFVLSDGEADGESDDDVESEPEDWNDNEFWYGRDDDDSGDGLYDVRTYGSPPDSDGGWETSSSAE